MFKNKSASVHQFAMVPRADIPRSSFLVENRYMSTIDSGYLIPFHVDEVLPGDSFSMRATLFLRLATPIVPFMYNVFVDTFWFFVPNRLLWSNWRKFMGEQANPGDSISYVVPQQVSPAGGYSVNSLQDYMGLPTAPQVGVGNTVSHCAFFTRAYNLIWNEWFRDENLQNSVTVDTGDGPDNIANYTLLRRGKRADYFTSALPWPQKGNTAVSLPLGTSAPVRSNGLNVQVNNGGADFVLGTVAGQSTVGLGSVAGASAGIKFGTIANTALTGLYADLSAATAATINQLRQAFQIQKVLERDARGGTRYTEIIRAHFGVVSPDARLQRPEYLGGGSQPLTVNPIAQTSATGVTGGTTPTGNLAAMGTSLGGSGFSQSFTEHGVIIGLASVRADLMYQQGLRKMWSRSTRYDFYLPAFAMLGEQPVLNREIYCDGSANDANVFGYQERWAEYRYFPSLITGFMKSTSNTPIDFWHLAQKFASLPVLNSTFIQENPPMDRVLAVTAEASGKQWRFDAFLSCRKARPLPFYSVPGDIDRF